MTTGAVRMSVRIALASCLSLAAGSAWAHHSFAQFDTEKTLEIQGTATGFTWTNPHVWIDMTVTNAASAPQPWGLESQSVGILYRGGWKPDSIKPGDKITVQIHPMKDGTSGGQVMKVTFPDGRVLLTGMARPQN